MIRASYHVAELSRDPSPDGSDTVFIVDHDEGVSVTNDAEAVVVELLAQYGAGTRIIYRDTMGEWSELKHNGQRFTGYVPYSGWTP